MRAYIAGHEACDGAHINLGANKKPKVVLAFHEREPDQLGLRLFLRPEPQ
jgi:hypothetical protein